MTFKSESRFEQWSGVLLVLVGIFFRLVPHPDNFTPVTAIALFSGVILAPGIALTLPLLVMIISDLIIGPHPLFWLTWGSFFAVTLLGLAISRKPTGGKILFATLGGSMFFYLVTNLGVFLFQPMYEKSFTGLVQCYVMALPFFRSAVIGDLFYSFVFFGTFILAKSYSRKFALQK